MVVNHRIPALLVRAANDAPALVRRKKPPLTPAQKQRQYELVKARIQSDPAFKIGCTLRSRVGAAVRNQSVEKADHTEALIGCTVLSLMGYLERDFVAGMTWANYGKWHIDHIRPCASFDLSDPDEQRKCFHFTNLRPLWAFDNISKGDRMSAADRALLASRQAESPWCVESPKMVQMVLLLPTADITPRWSPEVPLKHVAKSKPAKPPRRVPATIKKAMQKKRRRIPYQPGRGPHNSEVVTTGEKRWEILNISKF